MFAKIGLILEPKDIARCGTGSFFDGNRIFGFKASVLKGTQRQGVLVSEDCCNEVPQLGGSEQQKCILSSAAGQKSKTTLATLVLSVGVGEYLLPVSLLAAGVPGNPCSSLACGCLIPISASVFTWPSSL